MDIATHALAPSGAPETASGPARGAAAGRTIAWWGFGFAAFYAIFVRFYQAAGGGLGMAGEMAPEHQAATQMSSYLAGLLILLGGVACLYLGVPAVRRIPRWFPVGGGREIPGTLLLPLCLTPVVAGAVFAVAHAVVGVSTKSLALLGVIDIAYPDAWARIDETATAWWDLAFYEPCFLVLGVCLHFSAVAYLRDTGRRTAAVWTTRVSVGFVAVLAAVGVWMVATGRVWVV
ncbi:hypothetical protein AB0I28_06015 [Phytomonospora sp. NPDC050363]|uniref:hypothetical protein n=1 Tax=Phytomonospora sp. NPDC050363 TaxID=3155642 RepID=UPI0033D3520C